VAFVLISADYMSWLIDSEPMPYTGKMMRISLVLLRISLLHSKAIHGATLGLAELGSLEVCRLANL
jgi:hypothetical protein